MTPNQTACHPVKNLHDWPLLSAATSLAEDAESETISCKVSLTGTDKTSCHAYTALSNYFGIAAGLIETTATIAYSKAQASHPQVATDIWSISGTLYALIVGVNNQLIVAIDDINQGKPFVPIETPANLPPFPPIPTHASDAEQVIEGVWTALEGVLKTVLSKYQGKGTLEIALAGLLNNGEVAFNRLIPLLKQAFGS